MKQILFMILSLTLLYSTTISGEVFNGDSLKPINSTIITIEEESGHILLQRLTDSPYTVDIQPGNYTIRGYHFDNGTLTYYTDYKVQVTSNDMQLDMVLLPYELQMLSPGFTPPPVVPSGILNENNTGNGNTNKIGNEIYFYPAVLLILIVLVYWFFIRKQNKQHNTKNDTRQDEFEPDEDCQKIIKILRENDGRMVQKELRNIADFSETKMSLIVTELEVSGYIKKIKKGRGNMLKLVK